jgi:uncharacterized membrane protein
MTDPYLNLFLGLIALELALLLREFRKARKRRIGQVNE